MVYHIIYHTLAVYIDSDSCLTVCIVGLFGVIIACNDYLRLCAVEGERCSRARIAEPEHIIFGEGSSSQRLYIFRRGNIGNRLIAFAAGGHTYAHYACKQD